MIAPRLRLRALAVGRSLPASPLAVLRFTTPPPCSRLTPCRGGCAVLSDGFATFLAAAPLFWRLRRYPDGFAISQTVAPRLRTPGARGGPLASCVSACGAQIFTAPPHCSRLTPCRWRLRHFSGGCAAFLCGYAAILTASPPGRRSLLGSDSRRSRWGRSLPSSPPAVLRFTAPPPAPG